MDTTPDFSTPPSEHYPEVHLTDAPLVRVLCQVTWPQSTALRANSQNFVEIFSQELVNDYPAYESPQGGGISINFGAAQPMALANEMVHQFATWTGDWKVSLTSQFIALETSSYIDRDDFLRRLTQVLEALALALPIKVVQRVGFRYTNRLGQAHMHNLGDLLQPQMTAGQRLTPNGASVHHTYAECLYELGSDKLLARWATLPSGGSIDPTIEGSPEETWVLDLDAFTEQRVPFAAADVAVVAGGLAEIGYQYFRHATTDIFVKTFGGEK